MFTVEQLEAEATNLAQQVEQSAANHHILVGKKLAVEAFLAEAKKTAALVDDVAKEVSVVAEGVEHVVDAVTA